MSNQSDSFDSFLNSDEFNQALPKPTAENVIPIVLSVIAEMEVEQTPEQRAALKSMVCSAVGACVVDSMLMNPDSARPHRFTFISDEGGTYICLESMYLISMFRQLCLYSIEAVEVARMSLNEQG